MSASVRAQLSFLSLLAVAALAACEGPDAEPRSAPGGGVSPVHLDESDGEAGGSGGVLPNVGGDDMETLEGPCSEEGERHACRVKNAYGCVELEQRCVDGTWTACELMQDA